MDTSGKPHMMLVLADSCRLGGNAYFPFVSISHSSMPHYTVSLVDADISPAAGSPGLTNSNNALCAMIYTAKFDQFGTYVGDLVAVDKQQDIQAMLSTRLGLP
jgi:hypothetical protein